MDLYHMMYNFDRYIIVCWQEILVCRNLYLYLVELCCHITKLQISFGKPDLGQINGNRYIFIDESGDLGQYESRYFIVAAIVFNDDKIPKRIISHTRKRILNKKQKLTSELKANKSNNRIGEYVLKQIAKSDCSIFTTAVDKSKIFPELYQVKRKAIQFCTRGLG